MSGPTNPSETYFDKGGWGFDGSVWRPNNLTWGFYDRLVEIKEDLDADAGANMLTHTTVPAGELWVVTGESVLNTVTACQVVSRYWNGATEITFYGFGALTPGFWKSFAPAEIVLKAGDWLENYFTGCALHDQLQSTIFGYKMKVA
jgi:hypothetical protein